MREILFPARLLPIREGCCPYLAMVNGHTLADVLRAGAACRLDGCIPECSDELAGRYKSKIDRMGRVPLFLDADGRIRTPSIWVPRICGFVDSWDAVDDVEEVSE